MRKLVQSSGSLERGLECAMLSLTLQVRDVPASAGLHQRDVGIRKTLRHGHQRHERVVAGDQPQRRRPDARDVVLAAAVCT